MSDLFRSYLIAAGVHHICYVQQQVSVYWFMDSFLLSQLGLKRIDLLFMEM